MPDDLKSLALPALAHRLVVAGESDSLGRTRQDAERILLDILDRVPSPG
jgi:MoxR-like ATPase